MDFIRKFEISKDELSYRMSVLGQDATTIAEIFHKSPATVFRRAKAFGLKPSVIRRDYRVIWVPRDKVCFVLKVEPTRAADIEVIIKGILHEQRLQASTALEVFDVAPLAASPAA